MGLAVAAAVGGRGGSTVIAGAGATAAGEDGIGGCECGWSVKSWGIGLREHG